MKIHVHATQKRNRTFPEPWNLELEVPTLQERKKNKQNKNSFENKEIKLSFFHPDTIVYVENTKLSTNKV